MRSAVGDEPETLQLHGPSPPARSTELFEQFADFDTDVLGHALWNGAKVPFIALAPPQGSPQIRPVGVTKNPAS